MSLHLTYIQLWMARWMDDIFTPLLTVYQSLDAER